MATYPGSVKRFATGPLHGTGLAIYFVLLPYVVVTKWELSAHQPHGWLVRLLLVALGLFWLTFLFQVGRNVVRLRRGHVVGRDGSSWLAGLVVALLVLLIPGAAGAATSHQPAPLSAPTPTRLVDARWSIAHASPTARHHDRHRPPLLSSMGTVPLALMAKRRQDLLRQHQFSLSDHEIDDAVALLRAVNPELVAGLRHRIGEQREGVVRVPNDQLADSNASANDVEPVVVCVLHEGDAETLISFAREGGHLIVGEGWSSDDVVRRVVATHEGGRLHFAGNENELLRALATRLLRSTLVLYLGAPDDLDDELRACAITIGPAAFDRRPPVEPDPWIVPTLPPENPALGEVRVELLRSDPRIVGLAEPFTATLRRRCVEMVAYLALHRREPVTGDRLRTRVLTHADVDASTRTLANTASAVRRSLGIDAEGPRLHAVSSSGLYSTHAVTSDVEIFHALVTRARQLPVAEAAPLVRDALALIQGEPLACALRGFEWFLAEGHAARLARDGEWAALALHHDAVDRGDFELAYWAIEQGRRIDPYSDALVDALSRVPRLREFGGDGARRTQDESVGAGGAVVVGWPLNGLSDQIA